MAKKDKRTNNDLQNITHKTKDRVTRTPLKTWDEPMCSGRVSSFCSTSGNRHVTLDFGGCYANSNIILSDYCTI
jgi:hypothetical protein